MTTRTSLDGNIRRQIDYIAINAKYRNVAKKHKSTPTCAQIGIRTSNTE